ncbi:PAS domain S-box protein [Actinotalea sp. M2MS4P-6]|uniref:PAS domain S-box protein n=1 Tax=Actinotalea sp. M2MS4P-6 TaxID=2983762 RepID=UPI0021E4D860|nr:PAS domain S-box protein [Actinotalea sp. M2MS4P-6]MCV2395473.1 PAS domain S-box protein [Actinotalea sp. M2MS4P-6]
MPERGCIYLVADDEATSRALRALIESAGYSVRTVPGDLDAVLPALDDLPDLLVVHAYLDDDAFDLVTRLRARTEARDVPVIFVADDEDGDTRVRGLEEGDDVIVAPLEEREVLTRIERQVTVSKVRAALRESEAQFRSVMESAIDAIISADSDGIIRSWNSAAAALFGHTESEMVGQPIELIIPERFRGSHREGVHRVTTGGPTHVIGQTVELAALRRDGSEFPVELSLATWFLDDRRYYTGIIRDISERKQAEQKFRSVTESAIDAIISADHNGVIITWNSAATRILGYSEEEAVGQRLELVIPERYHDLHRAGMARFTATGEPHVIGTTVELSACTKSGDEIPIELSLSTWTVREDRYYTGIIRDIGERKAAEEALRQSEQALRERSEELRRKNDALQETLDQLSQMQDQLILQEKMASLGKLSAGMAHELNNPAAAAQRGAAQALAVFTDLQDNQLKLGMLGLDTEQRARLAALDHLARERAKSPAQLGAIERSDREAAFDDWLEDHGIGVIGDLAPALVALGFQPDELVAHVEGFDGDALGLAVQWVALRFLIYSLFAEITVGTNRIVELVTALKTYTYMDQAPVQDVDVREGLDNTLIILHNKLKRGVTVTRDYDEPLPRIQAYASELNQVWTNLIDNAIDAMGGTGSLTIRAHQDADGVLVEIEDDGPGIPAEVRSKIFDPFFTTKSPGKGTGLGLNISRNIVVTKHGGSLEVDSQPGRTRFRIRLPVRPARDEG